MKTKYIPLKRAAEECVVALNEYINGDKYEDVDASLFMKEIRDILQSGLKNEAERLKKKGD